MTLADRLARIVDTRPPIPGGYGQFCDMAWRNRAHILDALRLAAAVDAYEDAVECCDCEPSDWRCGHDIHNKSKAQVAALAAYRASAPKESR